MAQYRKKPVVIEAMLFTDKASGTEILEWSDFQIALAGHRTDDGGYIPIMEIKTLEGTMIAAPGDWIIRGVKGEFYPIQDDIFRETYEAVEP